MMSDEHNFSDDVSVLFAVLIGIYIFEAQHTVNEKSPVSVELVERLSVRQTLMPPTGQSRLVPQRVSVAPLRLSK